MHTGGTIPKEATPRSRRNAPRREVVATPEVRISRRVLYGGGVQIPGWHDFLDEHGEYHYGDGTTRTLGSMAVTYVNANEMGRLLSERYSKDYGSGRTNKTRQLVNKIHRDFNAYIREQDTFVTKITKNVSGEPVGYSNQFGEDDDAEFESFMSDILLPETYSARNKLWQDAQFVVRGVEPYKRQTLLGLDLSHIDNDALRTERQLIIQEFLKRDLKLATHTLSAHFDPHITFFEGNRPLSQINIRDVRHPSDIMLSAPQAVVNLKKM